MIIQKLSFYHIALLLALLCTAGSLSPMDRPQFSMDIQPSNNNKSLSQELAGEYLLCLAAKNNDAPKLTALIYQGVDVNARFDKSYNSPLHYAARKGHVQIGTILIVRGAFLNVKNKNGNTPLYVAAEKENIPFIKLLLQYGADQTIENDDEKTPMSLLLTKLYKTHIRKPLLTIHAILLAARLEELLTNPTTRCYF